MISISHFLIWFIAGCAIFGVITRPFNWPEAIWAVAGALALTVAGLLPISQAFIAVGKGFDVYCFLVGMMLLAGLARREGLFDWIAALAVKYAKGSARRLFGLVYLVGIGVTVFLSNDATAVVLTPAVYASAKAAGAKPLPYLLICAFVANAASFVLPISNPANLVVFRGNMPSLLAWLGQFIVPSILSIVATFVVLRWTQRFELGAEIAAGASLPRLSRTGVLIATGIGCTTLVLLVASTLGGDLGLPTLVAASITLLVVLLMKRESPLPIMREISWSVIPLVGGLFVLVQAIEVTDVFAPITLTLHNAAALHTAATAFAAGVLPGVLCNLLNNLPLGLLAGIVVQHAQIPQVVAGSVLVGIDLGPNLSVTGSLATILWLIELRKEGERVTSWEFLKLGILVMPPALVLSLGGLIASAVALQ